MQKKEYSLREIAEITDSKLIGDPAKTILHVSDLENATENDASFLANPRYEQAMLQSKAGVIFIDPTIVIPTNDQDNNQSNKNFLISDSPSRAFQKVIELFYGKEQKLSGFSGIHATAVIHESAKLGQNVKIGPFVVIDEEVTIGDNCTISSHCYIGPNALIGNDTCLHTHVTVRENCIIGNRVVIQPGAVIGSCGFGFTTDKMGVHTKLNQVGNVIIEDDVEIGANTTIDRSRFKSTKVGKGTKIDNLVQIAHGVTIGRHCIIVSQSGIAGSTEVGSHVIIGGQVAVNGHIKICDGAMFAARTGISKSITKPGKYGGYPAVPLNEFNRNHIYSLKLKEYADKLKELQAKVDSLVQKA